MFDGRWREAVDAKTGPVGQALHRHGVTADVLTATGLVSATATAVSVATGHLHLAILFLILTGAHDLFDGPVAKAAGTASVRGAFFDSVTDRVADAVLMVGVAWYLVSAGEGHLAVLPLAVLGVISLISYQRAKAEALGISAARGGLMERAERMILLGVGFLASWLLVPVLWLLLALTTATAVGRFVRVWKAAGAMSGRPTIGEPATDIPVTDTPVTDTPATDIPAAAAAAAPRAVRSHRRPARVESRWRAPGAKVPPPEPGWAAPASRSGAGAPAGRTRWPAGRGVPCGPVTAPPAAARPADVPGACAAPRPGAGPDLSPRRDPWVSRGPRSATWPTGASARPSNGCPNPWRRRRGWPWWR